MTSNKL